MQQTRQFATFLLHNLFFGMDVLKVQEVIRYQEMTRVPVAPPMIEGLINLRGQIITAIDLRRRLELPDRPSDQLPLNLVVRTEDGAVSLLVDEIGDVVDIEGQCFERVPETVTGVARELILGVYKLERRLLLILDTEKSASLPPSFRPLPKLS